MDELSCGAGAGAVMWSALVACLSLTVMMTLTASSGVEILDVMPPRPSSLIHSDCIPDSVRFSLSLICAALRSVWIRMSDPRGSAALDGDINADRHLVLNMTTGLAALIGSIMEGRNFSTRRYQSEQKESGMRTAGRSPFPWTYTCLCPDRRTLMSWRPFRPLHRHQWTSFV